MGQFLVSLLLYALIVAEASRAQLPAWSLPFQNLPQARRRLQGQTASSQTEISINGSDYPASMIDVPVDHFNASDTRKFPIRYWTNDTYYEPGAPVFWFDSGEQNAQPLVPYFLAEVAGPSAVMAMARRFNGLALIVEHRYYGGTGQGSYPFPMNATTAKLQDLAGYAFLNTEQALEDAVYIAHNFKAHGTKAERQDLGPDTTPWIWLGGSYPGVRGAQLRIRNPETFYAAWASSAPTEAAIDMWTYFAQAERSMTRNCSADFTAVTRYVDNILANGTEQEVSDLKIALYTAIQAAPGNRHPQVNETEAMALSNADVGFLLLTPFHFYQYYGFARSVLPFCDILETRNRTHVSTTDNGGTARAVAPASGLALSTGDLPSTWQAFLIALTETNYDEIISPAEPDPFSEYSWTWQFCSEYGYYQVGNASNPHTIQSQFISLDYFRELCRSAFPTPAESGLLPARPNVSAPNRYGGWNMCPSNTLFTSGQFDPWRALSPASIEEGSPQRKSVQIIPTCNEAPPGTDIFGLVHESMVHVSDMRALFNLSDYYHQNFSTVGFSSPISVEPFFAGTSLFAEALEAWLPCFNKSPNKGQS